MFPKWVRKWTGQAWWDKYNNALHTCDHLVVGLCCDPMWNHHTHYVSSFLLWFVSLNHKAFGNIFWNSQQSFHTSAGHSDSNNRGYQMWSLKNDCSLVSLYYSSLKIPERWENSCELQNKLPKPLLFITNELNSATVINAWTKLWTHVSILCDTALSK